MVNQSNSNLNIGSDGHVVRVPNEISDTGAVDAARHREVGPSRNTRIVVDPLQEIFLRPFPVLEPVSEFRVGGRSGGLRQIFGADPELLLVGRVAVEQSLITNQHVKIGSLAFNGT